MVDLGSSTMSEWADDDDDDNGLSTQESKARHTQFYNLGYREGITVGKEGSVQEGFDLGFSEASVAGFKWGLARGITSAFAALPVPVKESLLQDSIVRDKLQSLHSCISSISSRKAFEICHKHLMPNEGSDNTLKGGTTELPGAPQLQDMEAFFQRELGLVEAEVQVDKLC